MFDYVDKAKKMRPLIEEAIQSLDEKKGSKCVCLYPHWKDLIGTIAERDKTKFQHKGKLYCANSTHTFSEAWIPGKGTESLYREIPEWFEGTMDDPIKYSGNMALESGKYYTQDGVMYKCIRDSGIAVFDKLSKLATVQGGSYVEKVN